MHTFIPALALVLTAVAADVDEGRADLAVRETRLDPARARETFGFSVVVVNKRPDRALKAEVVVLLAPGMHVRNEEACKTSRGGGLARCALGTLKAGEERRVFLLLTSRARAPRVTAIAISETADPDPANNMR